MSPSKKVKTIRLHPDTHSRLKEYGKAGESFDKLVNRILDEYDVYKGKKPIQKPPIQKSPHLITKELKSLQDAFVDAVNSLRRTYSSENEWKIRFPFRNFGEALGFDWSSVDISEVNIEEENPTLLNLRRKWVQEIQKIVEKIKELTEETDEFVLKLKPEGEYRLKLKKSY